MSRPRTNNKIFKLTFGDEIRIVNPAPTEIINLRQTAKDLFNLKNPVFRFRDQEKHLITIENSDEYSELMRMRKKTLIVETLEKADLYRNRDLYRRHLEYMQPFAYQVQNKYDTTIPPVEKLPFKRANYTTVVKIEESDEDIDNTKYSIDNKPVCFTCSRLVVAQADILKCEVCDKSYHFRCLQFKSKPDIDLWHCERCSENLADRERHLLESANKKAKRDYFARK